MGIALKLFRASVNRAASVSVPFEDADHPLGSLLRHAPQPKLRAVRGIELHQRFDNEIAGRKPDRPPPVRVSAFQLDIFLSRLIAHLAVPKHERMFLMEL